MSNPSHPWLVIPAFLISITLHAQAFDTETLLNEGASGTRQVAPWITVAGDGTVYLLWTDYRAGEAGELYLASSMDGARTFTAGRPIITSQGLQAGMQRGAQLVVGADGVLHIIWQNILSNKIRAMYAHSDDGGITFSTPLAIAADSGLHNQDLPSIAVDSSGNVYAAWIDDRDISNGISNNTQLYFTKSKNGGVSFEVPRRAGTMPGGGGSCECCNTSIAVSMAGNVFISFRGNINNNRDIHVARSLDGGENFTVVQAASESWRIAACPMTGSSIAVDREETAHIVWRDSRISAGTRDFIYYTTLRREDTVCAPDMRISDSPKKSNYPSIGITSRGAIFVTYQDTRSDAADIYFTYSLDGGNTFLASTRLSASGMARQELATTAIGPGGERYVAWQDSRVDAADIRVTSDTSLRSTILPYSVGRIAPLERAVVAPSVHFAWTAPLNMGSALHVVYDIHYSSSAGSVVVAGLKSTEYTATLSPGEYLWYVVARTSVGESVAQEAGAFTVDATGSVSSVIRGDITLGIPQPHPIRCGAGAAIHLRIASCGDVRLALYNLQGEEVAVLLDEYLNSGDHVIRLDGLDLATGTYQCVLYCNGEERVQLIVIED